MIRSMYSGIGGMRNFQTKLDVIGNNISNVNTFGFKKGRTTFKDLVSQQLSGASNPTDNRGGTNPRQIGLGGTMATVDTIHTQGSLQTTGRALDLGISGDGFFVVNDGNLSYYTRAGNFYVDREGTLVSADGLRVQGYQPNEEGTGIDQARFGDLKIQAGNVIPPQATSEITFKGNLKVDIHNGLLVGQEPEVPIQFKVTDSLGRIIDMKAVFTKPNAETSEWTYAFHQYTGEENNEWGDPVFEGQLTFGPDGKPDLDDFEEDDEIEIELEDAERIAIPINANMFRNLTQFAGSNTADIDRINGNMEGFLESFNISQTGEINGIFTNGEVRVLGQIAMATFNNASGLTKSGDNLFLASNNSGVPNVGFAGMGRGVIAGSTLEMSNVDLSEEFTEMIVAQRGFQANTRIITTSDEILQELVNLKR